MPTMFHHLHSNQKAVWFPTDIYTIPTYIFYIFYTGISYTIKGDRVSHRHLIHHKVVGFPQTDKHNCNARWLATPENFGGGGGEIGRAHV